MTTIIDRCPECGSSNVSQGAPGCLPVCLACDWTGWITTEGVDTGEVTT